MRAVMHARGSSSVQRMTLFVVAVVIVVVVELLTLYVSSGLTRATSVATTQPPPTGKP